MKHSGVVRRPAAVVSIVDYRRRAILRPLAGELARQHIHLDLVFDALVDACVGRSWPDVLDEWRYFDPALRAHMEREERHLFPAFRDVNPEEVDVLAEQHGELRRTLDIIGVGMHLQSVAVNDLDTLATMLEEHAEHEARVFQRWIDRGVKNVTPVRRSPSGCPVG